MNTGAFMPYRGGVGPGFLLLSVVTGGAAIGCFKRRRWRMWFGVAIFMDNALSYIYQLFTRSIVEGGIGLVVSALLVFALLELSVRAGFD